MKNIENKIKNDKKKGFTLVEIMVVTAIFSILIITISSIFIASLKAERSILASKKVLGELSYAVEYMTRSLRMAEKDTSGTCIPNGSNYQITARGGIKFINALKSNACQEFFINNAKIKYATGTEELELTSSAVNILKLNFEIANETESDNLQPFVTIYIEANTPNSSVLQLQTSISQRNPDIR
ncbi:MAG: prepilin-type N-terminal cleavage/methylation domain-containing protein [Candidatus Parcubacteria bacterium]|nr:prepilin-type N-terminal cleavage/methylation domain-containing protein [Candidatus Parcubacteria bacterium]